MWSSEQVQRAREELHSVRFRVLATMLAFMAAGLWVAGGVTHLVQLHMVNDRVNAELLQDAEEFARAAEAGPNSDGSQPFASLDDLFRALLSRKAPGSFETVAGMIDGKVEFVMPDDHGIHLQHRAVVSTVMDLRDRERTGIHDVIIDGKTVRIAIVPVAMGMDGVDGTYVVGIVIGAQRALVFESLRTYLLVSLVTLMVAAAFGHALGGQLLRPVQRLREATESITFDELSRRVDVPVGRDDVSQLAVTFNRMLDRLEEGTATQRQFLNDAGHELRTPLTIIRGHLELLVVDDARDVANTRALLLDEIDRLHRLVDDLLTLAKAQRPDFLHLEETDVGLLAATIMEKLRPLDQRDWQVDEIATGIAVLDSQRVTQAVIQLAANAVKFTGVSDAVAFGCRIRNAYGPDAEPVVQFWVRDGGQGIRREEQAEIFERFVQTEGGRKLDGSGLGLAIVVAIAESHGGEVMVRSTVGSGSTFTLNLPLHRTKTAQP